MQCEGKLNISRDRIVAPREITDLAPSVKSRDGLQWILFLTGFRYVGDTTLCTDTLIPTVISVLTKSWTMLTC